MRGAAREGGGVDGVGLGVEDVPAGVDHALAAAERNKQTADQRKQTAEMRSPNPSPGPSTTVATLPRLWMKLSSSKSRYRYLESSHMFVSGEIVDEMG